jgi:hypothetical protein
MNNVKHTITLPEMKAIVKERVKKEYKAFLSHYESLPEHRRCFEMAYDSDKIAFYGRIYVRIVIIDDLYPEEWIRLFYLFDNGIIKEFYDSYLAFRSDSKAEEKLDIFLCPAVFASSSRPAARA